MENIILTNNKDLRLVSVKVGVLSTLRFELPLVSASATHVEVIVTSGNVHSAYTATFINDTKCWQCDIVASQFPAVGKQSYEVAYVLDGKQFWDGKGWIEIEDATTSGIEPQPRPEPYRYVVVSVNGYGADAQGAVRIPKTFITTDSPATTEGYMEGDIYFNKDTGATWTLCDVSGTLVWVFNYSNYYTKAETDEQIDRVAAYYITYDAQGNSFPTHAALVNASTYYSGGVARTLTRNDYAVVLADETHGGAKWRYIYGEADGQPSGQWEAQYPIDGVIILDNSVTRTSANGVKSSGIWAAIWGALTALPTGFASLYDWCVSQLAGKASTADATLTERGPNHDGFSAWTIKRAGVDVTEQARQPEYLGEITEGLYLWRVYVIEGDDGQTQVSTTDGRDAVFLEWSSSGGMYTATRTALPGYQLGSQTDKALASEAEAEALRTAVAGKLAASDVIDPANATASGKAADAKATGDALAVRPTKAQIDAGWWSDWEFSGLSEGATVDMMEWIETSNRWLISITVGSDAAQADSHGNDGEYSSIVQFDGIDVGPYSLNVTATRHRVAAPVPTKPEDIGAASRAADPTAGNLAALDAQGNPTNSGVKASDKLDATSAAPAFSTSATYAVGKHVTYNGKLYKCTTATTGGTWDASKWTAVAITDEMGADAPLPFDAEVEYLTVPVGAFIPTGIIGKGYFLTWELNVRLPSDIQSSSGNFRIGTWGGSTGESMLVLKEAGNLRFGIGSNYDIESWEAVQGAFGTIGYDGKNCYCGSNSTATSGNSNIFATDKEFTIFGLNGAASTAQTVSADIKGAKITISGALARDYIPVRVGTTGYLYDKVTGKLFGSGDPSIPLVPASDVTPTITTPARYVEIKPSLFPYDIGTPTVINSASSEVVEGETVNYGAATLADRTANIVQVTAATPLDELRITFPAATSGKVRDFGLRVEIGTGSAALAAPALVPVAPTGEIIKIENNAAEIPALADGTATAKGVTLLYFSENAPGIFVVKGEQVEEVA